MFYIGGVLDGAGKVAFSCCDGDLGWVTRQARQVWRGVRDQDREATWFVATLADSDGPVPVLDPAQDQADPGAGCRGC